MGREWTAEQKQEASRQARERKAAKPDPNLEPNPEITLIPGGGQIMVDKTIELRPRMTITDISEVVIDPALLDLLAAVEDMDPDKPVDEITAGDWNVILKALVTALQK